MARIVDNYNYLPGCCWFCRGIAKPIIDTEHDLDGHNSPEDPNPSATTRLYICADCAINLCQMVMASRGLELTHIGELGMAHNIVKELGDKVDDLETKLGAIANAVAGVASAPVEAAGSTPALAGDTPQSPPSAVDGSPLRRTGRPRREPPAPKSHTNTDFLDDL